MCRWASLGSRDKHLCLGSGPGHPEGGEGIWTEGPVGVSTGSEWVLGMSSMFSGLPQIASFSSFFPCPASILFLVLGLGILFCNWSFLPC